MMCKACQNTDAIHLTTYRSSPGAQGFENHKLHDDENNPSKDHYMPSVDEVRVYTCTFCSNVFSYVVES